MMEIPKDELPEWATGGYRSQVMVAGSEEHTIFKLKYGTVQHWWAELVKNLPKKTSWISIVVLHCPRNAMTTVRFCHPAPNYVPIVQWIE